MNGRLAALAEQAGYFIKFERTGSDVTVVHTKEPGTDGDLALFAELIIRECADVVRYYYIRGGEPITPQHITRHFGVE